MRALPWALGLATLAGCVNYRALSAGSTGCRPREITVSGVEGGWGQRSWIATCKGRDYGCALAAVGPNVVQASCSPREPARAVASRREPPAARETPSDVSRGYDEARKVRFVRAKVALPARQALALAAVPEVEPGKVQVAFAVPNLGPSKCDRLTLRVNAVPASVDEVHGERQGPSFVLKGSLDFAALKPLAQRYPQLSVQSCGEPVELTQAQVADVQRFLVMTADLWREVAPAPAAASGPESLGI